MQVVGTVVECQLVLFSIQGKLTFADTVAPTANQC